jgi:hypothetical protein
MTEDFCLTGTIELCSSEQKNEIMSLLGMLSSLARSRSDAIRMVSEADSTTLDPIAQRFLLRNLTESQMFLRRMGVDNEESVASIVSAMQNVAIEDIPLFVRYADQFHHERFPDSVMHGMDQNVANGNVPQGTQQAWIDAISAKMRLVFPGIPEADWAITRLKPRAV